MRVLATAVVFAVAIPLASATHQAFPGKAGTLVFQSNRDGNYELYVAKANGSGARKLLSRPQTDEFNPNWSPSGKKIVFQTGPPDRSTYDIWLVNADGKGARPLVAGATNDRAPQFCDDNTVVFTRVLSQTNADVYAIGTNGKGLTQLTSDAAIDSAPTCNPKGDRIAFVAYREGGNPRIYEMTRGGKSQHAITDPGAGDPDYSPDGKLIGYVGFDADRNLEIFSRNLKTGQVVQLTNAKPPFEYRLPKFAPTFGTRTAQVRADTVEDILATRRNTQSGEEWLYRVVTSGEPILLTSGGSGGSQQGVPCACKSLDAGIRTASRFVTERTLERILVHVEIDWTMTCADGVGGCSGLVSVPPPKKFRFGRFQVLSESERETNQVFVSCSGPCGKTSKGGRILEFGAGGSQESVLSVVLRMGLSCGAKTERKLYKMVFTKHGVLDRNTSDLNGNLVPDGKEK
jgi:hypothetical protein